MSNDSALSGDLCKLTQCPRCKVGSYEITEKLYDIVTKKWVNSYKCKACNEEW